MAAVAGGWAPLRELLATLVGPPFGDPRLLTDPAPDPGLFGPSSVTWTLARQPLLLLGGGRALLMQVADPRVAQAVLDHSDYASDPFGRLVGTVRWLVAVTFGTTAEARAATARVQAAHRRVRGTVGSSAATARVPRGTPYTAADRASGRWVHATIVESMLVSHARLVGPLDARAADAFVVEWNTVARLMGLGDGAAFADAADLHAYVGARVAELAAEPTSASRQAARGVLHPPLPSPALRPAFGGIATLTAALLPAQLRRAYGLRWTPAHALSANAGGRVLRGMQPLLPRPLRISPLHDAAVRRAEGGGLAVPGRAVRR